MTESPRGGIIQRNKMDTLSISATLEMPGFRFNSEFINHNFQLKALMFRFLGCKHAMNLNI